MTTLWGRFQPYLLIPKPSLLRAPYDVSINFCIGLDHENLQELMVMLVRGRGAGTFQTALRRWMTCHHVDADPMRHLTLRPSLLLKVLFRMIKRNMTRLANRSQNHPVQCHTHDKTRPNYARAGVLQVIPSEGGIYKP